MNEKTSEEKLREELERDSKTSEEKLREELERDSLMRDNPRSPSEDKAKSSRVIGVRRRVSSGTDKSVGQQVDSFIDAFEKKVEDSLSGVNVKTSSSAPAAPVKQEKPRSVIRTQNEKPAEDTEQNLAVNVVEEIPQIIPETVREPEREPEHEDIPQVIPEIEPEVEPANESDKPDDVPEESKSLPEIEPEPENESEYESEETDESEHEDELPDIPLIDSEPSYEEDDELPDIPVISADEVDEPDEDEELEEFEDIPVIDAEEEPEPEEEEPEAQSETEKTEDISSPADIVLNVDSDLPQITDEPDEEEPDPEAESAPVSVTMPETIKTAEDKLMADIAEAFTGNPLTLESKEAPEPYRLPEDFFTSQNNDSNAELSAEDKLKANIAQAMSESPIGIAQQQAMQDLEKDLNPFDEISLSELADRTSPGITEPEDESESETELEPKEEPEQEEEKHEEDEAFLPDFTDENDDASGPFDVTDEPEQQEQQEQEQSDEPEINLDELPLNDDNDEEPMVESDSELEVVSLDKPELEPEPEPELEPQPEPELESEAEPLTAQQRLEQEIAQFTQDAPDAPEESINTDIDTQQEEVSPENDMPDSLLDGTENDIAPQDDDEIGDDWDINSLGIVSEAASIPDDEPEPEPEIEPEPELDPSFMTEPTEETHKEKTMGLREKLAAKKNGAAPKDSSPASAKKSSSSSSGGGILLPLLLFLLLAVGALTLWQLYSLPDRLASIMSMNSNGVFEPISHVESNPSYDYAIDFILDQNIVERMSQRGREGWQVVGSRRTQDSTTGQYGYEIIFMKRIAGR